MGPGKQLKIEVSNSKLKPRQEPSMFLVLLTETNTTDFSTLPRVTGSRFATLVSLIMTIPTNRLHYLMMIKTMNLMPTQLLSVKMLWPMPKIQMKVLRMKISIQMTPILKLKLVVMKSSILMPPIDPLIQKIVGAMIVKGRTRKRRKKRRKKRKLKRKENENLLVMAKTGNRQRRKKRKFPVSQREVFHLTSSMSVTIVKRSSRTMLALVSPKLPKFSVHNGRLSVLKKKLHMKS